MCCTLHKKNTAKHNSLYSFYIPKLPKPLAYVVLHSHSLDARKGGEFDSALSLGRKSQDAAVGALVRMLRTAPPLRQDSSFYSSHSQSIQQQGNFGTATGFFMPRKAADALEELKSYREMKDLLLSRSGNQVVSREDAQAPPLDIKRTKT